MVFGGRKIEWAMEDENEGGGGKSIGEKKW